MHLLVSICIFAIVFTAVAFTKPRTLFDSMGSPIPFGTAKGAKPMSLMPLTLAAAIVSSFVMML